jgi:hypothetical protein
MIPMPAALCSPSAVSVSSSTLPPHNEATTGTVHKTQAMPFSASVAAFPSATESESSVILTPAVPEFITGTSTIATSGIVTNPSPRNDAGAHKEDTASSLSVSATTSASAIAAPPFVPPSVALAQQYEKPPEDAHVAAVARPKSPTNTFKTWGSEVVTKTTARKSSISADWQHNLPKGDLRTGPDFVGLTVLKFFEVRSSKFFIEVFC